ncbi:hypothetical protein [Streptococcus parasuis]
MDDIIKSNLAIVIAQLSLDKATLEAENDELRKLVKEQADKLEEVEVVK